MPARRSTAQALRDAPPVAPDTEAKSGAELALRPVASPSTLGQLLAERQNAITESLPAGMDFARFRRLLIVAAQRDEKLLACTVGSIIGAALISAQLGLEPDALGHVYLIPFRDTKRGITLCQVIVGFRGYAELASRHRQVASPPEAEVVYKGDEFEYELGTNAHLKHIPKGSEHKDEDITHAWAIVRLTSGATPFVVLTRQEIEKRRGRSRASDRGPWVTDYAAMCRKTAVRALATSGKMPMSVDIDRAERVDEAVTTELRPDLVDTLVIDMPSSEVGPVGNEPPADSVPASEQTPPPGPPVTPGSEGEPSTEGSVTPPAPSPSVATPVDEGKGSTPGAMEGAPPRTPEGAAAATPSTEQAIDAKAADLRAGQPSDPRDKEVMPSGQDTLGSPTSATTAPAAEVTPTGAVLPLEQAGGSKATAGRASTTTTTPSPTSAAAPAAGAPDPFADVDAGPTSASSATTPTADRFTDMPAVQAAGELIDVLHTLWVHVNPDARVMAENIVGNRGWNRELGTTITGWVRTQNPDDIREMLREAVPALAEIRAKETHQ